MTEKKLAVVDGDIILYQACSVVEFPLDWGNDMWTLHSDAKEAKAIFNSTLEGIMDMTGCSKAVICLSGDTNWRKVVMPSYKANRSGSRKPVCYSAMKSHVIHTFDTMIECDLEGDDCIGLIATGPKSRWRGCSSVVMVSEDKDLGTVPGVLFNPRTGQITETSKQEADRFHLYQALVGDAVDNYSGCPGIGKVRASKILDQDCSWDSVVKAYVDNGLTIDDALTQARVARILRHREYNFRTKDIRLWNPPRQPRQSSSTTTM